MTGARTTIYLDDELQATAKLLKINVSEICQHALAYAIEARLEELQQTVAAAQTAQDLLMAINGRAERISIGEHAEA